MAAPSIFDELSPADLGLPAKFSSFRPAQRQALDWLATAETTAERALGVLPVLAACMPTGVGKTAIGVSLARLLGAKAAYLVATKALQEQVLADFRPIGMVDIRGRSNYRCPNFGTCEVGSDHKITAYDQDGNPYKKSACSLYNTPGCRYSSAVEQARDADLVVTNYAYWLYSRMANRNALERDGKPVDLLISDEAHALEGQLTSFASVTLGAKDLGMIRFDTSGVLLADGSTTVQKWAAKKADKLADDPDLDSDEEKQSLLDRLRRIQAMDQNWVWQYDQGEHGQPGTSITFSPIRLPGYIRNLISGVPRVVMMSASLTDFAMRMLMPSDLAYAYRAWSAVFPPQNAPVYHIPTRKLSWKSTDEDYQAVIEQADQIISARDDRKGIIHTVSYARSKRALQYSAHSRRFIWNDDGAGLSSCLERFRASPPGTVLVTPSVGTGFDFPGEAAEYQIILKFPFPNEMDRVIKERCRQISGYRLWSAAQSIVQMCGRARRYAEDRSETFILDNAVRQLCGPEGKKMLPPGFRIFTVNQIPKAPPKL